MTNKNARRQQIEEMLQSEPDDRLLRYCLAIEMHVDGDSEDAVAQLTKLCGDKPPHVAAFFKRAQVLVELDRVDEARAVLRDGIEEARRQGDMHAAGEMSELLSDLGQYGE